ncbi:MAG: dihydrolipoamide acetyltransferase family protein [Gemmatimonadales bacterium]
MTTLTDILLPTDQTEGTSNVVGAWFKQVGDPVAADEPLLEITTDKVTVEIAAPAAGTLVEILKAEGEEVTPGEVLGRIGPAGAGAATSAAAEPTPIVATPSTKPTAIRMPADGPTLGPSPAARRMLRDHGLDASAIVGTGRGGRIRMEDIERHLASRPAAPAKPPRAAPAAALASRRVPHSQMRKSIAAHMQQSVATAPHVTSVFEADLSAVIAHRGAHKARYAAAGTNLTYTAYFVRASVAALQAVPEVNSRWHDDALELFGDCNVGVGTALEGGGLIVPVLKGAQALDLPETAARLHDLTTRARSGSLSPKDVQDGTFTISNHGVSGSLLAAPIIINQPQSAILGLGKLQHRPVAVFRNEIPELVVKPMIYVTLTIDHRVLDGFQANAFLSKWVEVIEGPWA